jgi:uncharacterized phiE125 gp8 family phage protein
MLGYVVDTKTAPSGAPVTLEEAKAHLRVLHGSEDALITRFVSAATSHVELWIGRSLVTRTLLLKRDDFPRRGGAIPLPYPPVAAVASVTYKAVDGSEQTLAAEAYHLVSSRTSAELVPSGNSAWPAIAFGRLNVTIEYTAGYGAAAAVPEDIRNAVLLLIEHFYSNRGAVADTSKVVVPMAVEALLGPHRTHGWI